MLFQVSLNTYNHHYTETHNLYLVYLCPCLDPGLFMSYLSGLLLISASFSLPLFMEILEFSIISSCINHITSLKQTHMFFVHFLEYLLLFLGDNVDEKGNNFQIAKVQPQLLLSFWLIFCQFQPDVAYKSVASTKKRIF